MNPNLKIVATAILNYLMILACASLIRNGVNILCLRISISIGLTRSPQEEQVYQYIYGALLVGNVTTSVFQYSGIPEALPACAKEKRHYFSTPTEIVTKLKSVSQLDVPYPMSWVDEERDTSCWLGNVMQREASINCIVWPNAYTSVTTAASSKTGIICRQVITSAL